jgi:hypothetical protein
MKSQFKIAHIINPVNVGKQSDLYTAQPVTFETIRQARRSVSSELDVDIFTTGYPEDEAIMPVDFNQLPPLQRSVHDFGRFNSQKKLPLLKDILDRLYDHSDADYFIYSNVDIALMPEFYKEIKKIIERGNDAFAVNRRTISRKYSRIEEIPLMRKEVRERSHPHPGFDCFIFRRAAYPKYILGTACVGGNWIGRVLLINMIAFADSFEIFRDKKWTFHLGNDRCWEKPQHNSFNQHNEDQLNEVLGVLLNREEIRNKEKIKEYFPAAAAQNRYIHAYLSEIIKIHSPSAVLPDSPEKVYHSEFRYSNAWDVFKQQKIRQDPVFIVGYPRSGTTLIQGLLATQENVVSFPETHFFSLVRSVIHVDNDRIQPDCLEAVISRIRERTRLSQQAEAHIKQTAGNPGISVKMLFENIVIDNLISQTNDHNFSNLKWVEKTPDHVYWLDVIFRFYPRAKIIYVMRNPEKAILSRRRNFTFNNEARWPLQQHVQLWLKGVEAVEKYKRTRPQSVLIVKLEDVVSHTREKMKAVCGFADISFDEMRLHKHREVTAALVHSWESWKKNAGEDISSKLALRPLYSFDKEERDILIEMAYKELDKYGYLGHLFAGEKKAPADRIRRQKKSRMFFMLKKSFQDYVAPLFKHYPGKINLSSQLENFYGKHRSGWSYAVRSLSHLHNPRGIYLDAFIERTFAWNENSAEPHFRPWIGFIHVPPQVPYWFQSHQSNHRIFQSRKWEKSLPFCRGLFTLSRYHRDSLKKQLDIPVDNLIFPTESPELKWDWDKFQSSPEKKIIQVGWWLRRLHSIFRLPAGKYRKIFLKVDHFNWDYLIHKEYEILKKSGLFSAEMYDTADTVGFVSNEQYDRLLAENIIFLHLYDSSANNTIIECLVRNTPLLVNPLPAVKEYLGEDYPFYFNSLEEAAEKAEDEDMVQKTHLYLLNHPSKDCLSGEYFAKSFEESKIYRNL